ncbi:MAG: type II toxin-antitoxin system RelE/ParE family toxin [Parasporobacterium sp.]|nr:type II toxin-antitoxin system RelE/ParE family toxin [Parasporobacterium sp.]
MVRTFYEMKHFTKKWQDLGFTDDELSQLQQVLLENPKAGDVMKGTGGLRKVRFAFPGSGKSGSVRVCYIDVEGVLEIHLIDVFAKNEKENLSKAERNAIRIVVEQIKAERLKAKR